MMLLPDKPPKEQPAWQVLKGEGEGEGEGEGRIWVRVVSRPNSLPLPYRTPATQAHHERGTRFFVRVMFWMELASSCLEVGNESFQ